MISGEYRLRAAEITHAHRKDTDGVGKARPPMARTISNPGRADPLSWQSGFEEVLLLAASCGAQDSLETISKKRGRTIAASAIVLRSWSRRTSRTHKDLPSAFSDQRLSV